MIRTGTVFFTGGGTGGHVFPGLAVREALPQNVRSRVEWICSRGGMERAILAESRVPYHAIPAGKLRRYVSLENVMDLFRVAAGILAARRILVKQEAAVLFSKGGFVAVPVVLAAWSAGVPVIIHESDDDPGLATRLSAPFARHVCVARREVAAQFPRRVRRKVVVTGNPVRPAFLNADASGVLHTLGIAESSLPVILVTGGSLGARQVNQLVDALLPELTAVAIVVHQTGEDGAPEIPRYRSRAHPGRYCGAPQFHDDFPALMRRADLVIARAGAGTIWELAVTATPAILIPLSRRVSRGDQLRNARRYCDAGGALVLDPETVSPEQLQSAVGEILGSEEQRSRMAAAARRFAGGDAASSIAGLLQEALQ